MLTDSDWRKLHADAQQQYRLAWETCDRLAKLGEPCDAPALHFAAKRLRAAIDVLHVCEHHLGLRETCPVVEHPRSLHYWVLPHDGGGVVPGGFTVTRARR